MAHGVCTPTYSGVRVARREAHFLSTRHRAGVSSSHISISLNCWILSKLLFLGFQAKNTINKHKKKGAAEETEPMDVECMAQQSMVIILTAQYVHRSITP